MADVLIRQWRLVVLKVELDLSRRVPVIASRLVAHPHGRESVLWRREDPLEAFGLPRGSDPPSELRIPDSLAASVDEAVETCEPDPGAQPALWLRLVPPYGYLGAVPWEELTTVLGMPVLRVPDRLPVPVDLGPTWSMALVTSAPPRSRWGADHIRARVASLRRHLTVPWSLDVFVDVHTHQLLGDAPELAADGRVRLHDPRAARVAHEERGRRRQQLHEGVREARRPLHAANLLWSDWVAAGLQGRAVRALHAAAPGAFEGDHPVITFGPDPADPHGSATGIATDDELSLLADVLGASLISFSSPPGRHSDVAIRMLADRIGQSRPGPTVYSSMRGDPRCETLAVAEAFLADRGRAMPVPQHPSLFAYIQPEAVQTSLSSGWSEAASETVYGAQGEREPSSALPVPAGAWDAVAEQSDSTLMGQLPGGAHGAPGAVPAWVASSARFIDTRRAALMNAAAAPGEPAPVKRAYDQGVASALADMEALILRRAGESR